MYYSLTSNDSGLYQKRIWKGKIPPKIKIFMWLMSNDAILTKDTWLEENERVTLSVCYVKLMKALITYSSNVLLLELSDLLWQNALELLTFPII
jgi:hypothetical protein